MRAKHPWLFRRGDTFYLRAKVPVDLRAKLGRAEIKVSLRTRDRKHAERLIHAEAAKLQRQFDRAREVEAVSSAPLASDIDLLAMARRWFAGRVARVEGGPELCLSSEERSEGLEDLEQYETLLTDGDDRYFGQCFEAASRELSSTGYVSRDQIHALARLLMRAELEVTRLRIRRLRMDFSDAAHDALFRAQEQPQPMASRQPATALSEMPLLCSLKQWERHLLTKMKPRQVGQYVRDLSDLSTHLPDLGDFRRSKLQAYLEAELRELSPNTIVRKFSAYRNYWAYLRAHDLVPRDQDPFKDLLLPKKAARGERVEWTPNEVCQLWKAARVRDMRALGDVIRIAAFTGSRIEAICKLTTNEVIVGIEGQMALRFSDKTDAGRRDVPVHSAIAGLIRERMENAASHGGYLIPTTARNKHGERSAGIGKQFGRLKTELGFQKNQVFHNLRRTVVELLSAACCPEAVAADIIGHERPTMTYGLYRGTTELAVKRHWLELALVYPDPEFMKPAQSGKSEKREGGMCNSER